MDIERENDYIVCSHIGYYLILLRDKNARTDLKYSLDIDFSVQHQELKRIINTGQYRRSIGI